MKVAIYSALYGEYEYPKPLPDFGVPAYLYTDDPLLRAPGWTTVYVDPHPVENAWKPDQDPVATKGMMLHKYWKTHPAEAVPGADITLWLDASMEVTLPDYVGTCIEALGEDEWVAVTHPWRDCIYDEAAYSGTLPRYDKEALDRQSAFYRDVVGHPVRGGLFATGANVRRHTDRVIQLCESWWDECCHWSHQDQVSLPVLFRLTEGLKWNTNMPWHQWWINHPHGR